MIKHWTTVLHVDDLVKLAELEQVCKDISARDQSFHYSVNPKTKKILIYSDSRDLAHRRGMWFHHKFGLFYDVYFMAAKFGEE